MRTIVIAALALVVQSAQPAAAQDAHFKVVAHWKMPDGGFDYGSVDSAKGRVYWGRENEITTVDAKTGKVAEIPAPGPGHTTVVVPGTNLVVESHGVPNGKDNGIAIVDVAAKKVLADIPAGNPAPGAEPGKGPPSGFPDGAAYDPASKLVYVMTHFDAVAYVVNPMTRKLVAKIPVGTKDLEFPAADGKGHLFVNSPGSKEIAVIDTKAQKVTARYPMTCEAGGLAYASRSNLLISGCDDAGLAQVLDASTGKLVASIKVGHGMDSVQYDEKDQLAMVPCQEEGKLYIVSVANPGNVALVQTVDLRKGTRTGAWDERNDRGYYMGGEATDKRLHGHIVLAPGTLELMVVGG